MLCVPIELVHSEVKSLESMGVVILQLPYAFPDVVNGSMVSFLLVEQFRVPYVDYHLDTGDI